MSSTNAIIDINDVVDGFMFAHKLPTEDAVIFTEHACRCYVDIRMNHSNEFNTLKVTTDANGIIEMPDDLIKLHYVFIPVGGEWWSLTERPLIVNTTTISSGLETQNSLEGEGVDIADPQNITYGGTGGANEYYYMVDFEARRIFVDGMNSGDAVLRYISSGLNLDGNTLINVACVPVIESYMMWKKAWWDGSSANERDYRKQEYKDEVLKLRLNNFMPTKERLSDALNGMNTTTPLR